MTAQPAPDTTRLRLDLGYRGTDFHGWARQPGLRTVQGILEEALEKVCGAPVRTVVAGRTDAGVHARRQVVHLDLAGDALDRLAGRPRKDGTRRTPAQALVSRLRGVLGHLGAHDVVIHAAAAVPDSFDARFAALRRTYTYRIADESAFLDPLRTADTVVHCGELDAAAMQEAATQLLGLHDFLPFCKPREESTTIRTLEALDVTRDEAGVIVLEITADAFCHHMVRATVGALVKVGTGSWPVTRPAELVARAEGPVPPGTAAETPAGSRTPAASTAPATKAELGPMHVMPAHGLVLERIDYPDDPDEWALRVERTKARRDTE
ncbi:tRNA pseudouridine(38-40) synthase TruA [Brevibacterium litoralis]|uniref:tRNA pseudouridine(38-40) synthase TruA n=1 Tax=Brevibacterium litoralis TaxID=3138935 RepID=UPI0032EE5B7B